jgi:hypothetical protein
MWGDTRFLECPFILVSSLVGAQSSLPLAGYVWLYIGLLHHTLYPVLSGVFFAPSDGQSFSYNYLGIDSDHASSRPLGQPKSYFSF